MTELQEQARALGDPTRHRIFGYVADADHAVGVAELTEHLGVTQNAVRQHLAKLVAAGLLSEHSAPPVGPGRPRLLYQLEPAVYGQWGVAGPYERLSTLLTEVIRAGRSPQEVGRDEGRRRAVAPTGHDGIAAQLRDTMARDGFEPEVRVHEQRVEIVLRRCPFVTAVLTDPETVCSLHLGIAEGLTDGVDGMAVDEFVARDPREARCRLGFRFEDASSRQEGSDETTRFDEVP